MGFERTVPSVGNGCKNPYRNEGNVPQDVLSHMTWWLTEIVYVVSIMTLLMQHFFQMFYPIKKFFGRLNDLLKSLQQVTDESAAVDVTRREIIMENN